jgi:hypothetical protein
MLATVLIDEETSEKIAFKTMGLKILPFELMAKGKDVTLRKALYRSEGVGHQRVYHQGRRHNVCSKRSTSSDGVG